MDYEKLYETCYLQVYSYVMTLSGDPHLSEEITADTFYRAMTAGKEARFSDRSRELTWLCSIARNLFYDRMRKKKRTVPLTDEIPSSQDVDGALSDREMSFRIHRALHDLDEPYKEVFSLRVFGELPFAKIGELFGKTETWARVTYHRAALKIRERMGLS